MIRIIFTISLALFSSLSLMAQWDLKSTEDTAFYHWGAKMVTDSIIFVGGFYDDGTASTTYVMRTTDQGNSWDTTYFTMVGTVRTFSFPSIDTGYFGSDGGAIYKTIDSGSTWFESHPILLNNGVSDLTFTSTEVGYGVNADGSPLFIYTVDGGQNWTLDTTGLGGRSIDFPSPAAGYFSGGQGVMLTQDSGNTWTAKTGLPDRYYVAASFATDSVGWLGGNGFNALQGRSVISKISNYGDDFEYWDFDIQSGITAIVAPKKEIVYALGHGNVAPASFILKTDDDGINWGYQLFNNSTMTPNIRMIDCLNDSLCVGVGANGQVFLTTNGGGPMLPLSTPVSAPRTQLKVYPNPASETVTLNVNGEFDSGYSVRVYNILGAIVQEFTTTETTSQIDIRHCLRGVYIVEVSANDKKITRKLIKH